MKGFGVERIELTLGHSPDPDDAFMWWPITGKIDPADPERVIEPPVLDCGRFSFRAVPADIAELNTRAVETGDLDITAVSMHAWAHVADRYVLTRCGASMGDGYGPKVVVPEGSEITDVSSLRERVAAGSCRVLVPGATTSAFLALRSLIGAGFAYEAMRFDAIPAALLAGQGDVGIIIHDAQLTFDREGLALVVDLGQWWTRQTGLPLALGANAVRRDLDERFGAGTIQEVSRLLGASIAHAMVHRDEGVAYAMGFAVGEDAGLVERFIGLYVNALTVDAGETGRLAVERLLEDGASNGLCPAVGVVEMV